METWREDEDEDAAFACEGKSQFLLNLELHGGQKQMCVSLKVPQCSVLHDLPCSVW